MSKQVKECPFCGEKSLLHKTGEYLISHPDTGATVARIADLEWEECLKCGEHFLDDKAMNKVEEEKYRSKGLLLPRELKAIRESFGLTQVRMAKVLDVGEKTYCRWENGLSMQTKALDNLVRSVARNPKGLLENEEDEQKQAEKLKSVEKYLERIKQLSGPEFALALYDNLEVKSIDRETITKVLRRKKREDHAENHS